MRCLIIGVVALLAACASTPVPYSARDLLGCYQMMDGPECWFELELQPDGACDCWLGRAVGTVTRTHVPGTWRIEGATVAFDINNDEFKFFVGAAPLAIKRWDSHVYLVPARDIAFFDQYGPVNELCFSQDGARYSRTFAPGAPTRPCADQRPKRRRRLMVKDVRPASRGLHRQEDRASCSSALRSST